MQSRKFTYPLGMDGADFEKFVSILNKWQIAKVTLNGAVVKRGFLQ